ncbi:MAG: hypothetical protein GVY13_13165 [Alphaproteobacteria bacterium]|jgi:nitrogenase-stabilizing/protective protein|nr:hypothetical protein [Alphaproteobacteria bacterium]
MTDLRDQLAKLESAEEFFDLFGVPYDPSVLAVHRLRVLRRLRGLLAAEGVGADTADDELLAAAYGRALARAYAECRDGTGPAPKEAAAAEENAPATTSFVPLTSIRGRRRGG